MPRVQATVNADGPLGEPEVSWGDRYPVVQLGIPHRKSDLPGEKIDLESRQVKDNGDSLIHSERSGGTRAFLDWWRRQLSAAERPWVQVRGQDWDPLLFQWSDDDSEDKKVAVPNKDKAEQAIQRFGTGETRTERAAALIEWAAKLEGSPMTLIVRDIESLGEVQALQAATALRALRDPRDRCPGLHLVVASCSEDIFLETANASGFRRWTHQYRLPAFDLTEARILAASKSKGRDGNGSCDSSWKPVELRGEPLETFYAQTGGQPLLVKRLLHRIQKAKAGSVGPVTAAEVGDAVHRMRASPPGETRFWQDELEQILKNDPEFPLLLDRMEAYVTGKSLGEARFPPHSRERALFIGGWLKLDDMGRWGISSRFHVFLAQPVLDKVRRTGR